MATFNKAVVDKRPVFAGTWGNGSVGIFTYTATGEAIGSEIIFGKVPRAAIVYSVKLVNAALGASSTIKVGYRTAEIGGVLAANDAYWLAATGTSTAASTASIAAPKQMDEEVYIIGTTAGGTITGVVSVVVEYLYQSK